MFDIGFQELVIIFVVALLVFGPKRLPEVGRTLGKWIGELRKGIYDAKMQMESEFDHIEQKTEQDTVGKVAGEESTGSESVAGRKGSDDQAEEGGAKK